MPVRSVALLDGTVDDAGALAVLRALGERYVLGLVTRHAVDAERSEPARSAHFRLAADDVGIPHTDVRLFRMAAAAAGCHPNELVVVGHQRADDRAGHLAVAQAAGCYGVWLNPTVEPTPPGIHPDATITDLHELPGLIARFDADEAAAAGRAGVGPHPEPWPAGDHLDPALLAGGDRRNVVDRYRYWREEAIVADLDRSRHPFHVAVENWRHDRNIGAVVRNANAFGAGGVHIVGRRRWNRRGAMATDRYLAVHHHHTVDDLVRWATDHRLVVVGIDNVAGARPLETSVLPERCVLVFGQEGPGLSPTVLDVAERVCAITQFGSTRSINAGVASGIAMHTWVRQHALAGVPGTDPGR